MTLLSRLPHSLYIRVVVAMISCITLVLASSTAVMINQAQAGLANDLHKRAESQAVILSSAANAFVAEVNTNQLTAIAAAATAQHEIQYIAFYDNQNGLLASATDPDAPANASSTFADLRAAVASSGGRAFRWADSSLDIVAPIMWLGQRIGFVGLRFDTSSLVQARGQALRQGVISAVVLIFLLSVGAGLFLRHMVIGPLQHLSAIAEQIGRGEWAEPPGQDRVDELGLLARSFAHMVAALQSREAMLQEQMAAVRQLNADLDTKVVERTVQLHNLVADQEHLLNQIHDMSIPVVPVLEGVIVVPLIGILDNARAERMMRNVLAGIEQQRAHLAILDITGVPLVDTQVAHALIQVTQAMQLLGTSALLVGIRPEVASTLVLLGVDLREIQTFATLQEALRQALGGRSSVRVSARSA